MNKFFFLIILFVAAGAASMGLLAGDLDLVAQKLGIFHSGDANMGLTGCRCVDWLTGLPTTCDNSILTNQLCPLIITGP